ncbi:hypothetical protein [Streptomyces natalensis]|uniref:Head-to-tail adaptor n=1 Tax=Streptomyces natalensis ATCC 27448 TaxID=1240678 RepID=A0A0D7CMC7_9ACTN|nr:hypothetical protein [Streptomyces natalensis]KIZ17333.1 hypothetical protein SNA_15045 [Streptomyces natalensis ATCC 27448]
MEPLADVAALEQRLGRSLVGEERAQAEAALSDASTTVRAYGDAWPDPAEAPAIAVAVTLAAAERRVRNPEGYRSELQGAYQYQLPASLPVGAGLTDGEARLIRAAVGASGVFAVPVESLGGSL